VTVAHHEVETGWVPNDQFLRFQEKNGGWRAKLGDNPVRRSVRVVRRSPPNHDAILRVGFLFTRCAAKANDTRQCCSGSRSREIFGVTPEKSAAMKRAKLALKIEGMLGGAPTSHEVLPDISQSFQSHALQITRCGAN